MYALGNRRELVISISAESENKGQQRTSGDRQDVQQPDVRNAPGLLHSSPHSPTP